MAPTREHWVQLDPDNPHQLSIICTAGDTQDVTPEAAMALAGDLVAAVQAMRLWNATGLATAQALDALASPTLPAPVAPKRR